MKKLIIITLTLLTCAHGLYAMDAQSNLTDKLNKDLFAAVKCNNTQQAKTLLEQKADVNATKCDSLLTESGRLHQCCSDVTPLHHAVSLPLQRTVPELELDPTSMVEMLIAHKANVNAVAECPFGKTPLHLAASCNKPIAEILVKTLIKAGALVNAKEKSGDLPLCCALKANSYYAIPPLLEVGAHVDTTIVLQLTPHLHQFLDRTKWMSIHLHTRKLLATTVCPADVQHIIPSCILFKNRKILGHNVGKLIMDHLLFTDKLCLAQNIGLLPGPWSEDELKSIILQNTNNAIKKLPPLPKSKDAPKDKKDKTE